MSIEEFRERFVGKLVHIVYGEDHRDWAVGVCTEIEIDPYDSSEVTIHFTHATDGEYSYWVSADNGHRSWHMESLDHPCTHGNR